MFGNKNKILMEEFQEIKDELEMCDAIVTKLEASDKDLRSARLEVQESVKQMDAGINQISENLDAAAEMAHENVELGHSLMEQFQTIHNTMDIAEAKRVDLGQELDQMYQVCMELVESNKHYTDLSKNMTEATSELLTQDTGHLEKLNAMSELGKQMGVLALNSAIEAGRLGESGKDFVNAAEEVRVLASQYEANVVELRAEIAEHNEKVQFLEDEVKRLIGLLKDSNIASTKLMKRSGQAKNAADALAEVSINKEMEEMKNCVSTICSAEEEAAKMQERNRMQISDIAEETKTQNQYLSEMDQLMKPILEDSVSYIQRRKDNE